MKNPKNILIEDYLYGLPEERVAQYPLDERDGSKLLIYKNGVISESRFNNIESHLPEKSLLVFNDTKVIHARLNFKKPTGAAIEIFCIEPYKSELQTSFSMTGSCRWKCLIGNAVKWKSGALTAEFKHQNKSCVMSAEKIENLTDCFVVEFRWQPEGLTFAEALTISGKLPLPPYIKRDAEISDETRYQTVYARSDGSVAAPTAGLHFTDSVLKKIREKNIETEFLTLHVGIGTFKPVKSERIGGHDMHSEMFFVNKKLVAKLLQYSQEKTIAVGTTTLRALESLYWLGVRILKSESSQVNTHISQWEVYENDEIKVTYEESLNAILGFMTTNETDTLVCDTQIMIAPGYEFKTVSGLITNFHRPRSTLLLLIAAFIGEDWRRVYDYAMKNDFRFLSYGDSSLLVVSC